MCRQASQLAWYGWRRPYFWVSVDVPLRQPAKFSTCSAGVGPEAWRGQGWQWAAGASASRPESAPARRQPLTHNGAACDGGIVEGQRPGVVGLC